MGFTPIINQNSSVELQLSRLPRRPAKTLSTSWEPVEKWYRSSVKEEGHYYHQRIVLPGVLQLMDLKNAATAPSVLDIACGQGVLARQLPSQVAYTGIDASPSLIKAAKQLDDNPLHHYVVADVTRVLPLKELTFSHATIILALQNVEHPERVIKHAAQHLQNNGTLIIVLNHPCFRIARQSSWGVDQQKKIQYRRVDSYASPMSIPIQAHPSKGAQSPSTCSFHFPLSLCSHWLHEAGLVITLMDEWYSDKVSTGGAAKMENRSRKEFPLFLAIVARKIKLMEK
jgi:SAM-dependent methyltransferase